MSCPLTRTTNQKHVALIRIIAGAPLLFFGIMHLSGLMPMKPLVEAAGLPMPSMTAFVAPLAQIIAGALLLAGALARIGGLIAIGTMLGAVMTHIKIPNDAWPMPTKEDPAALGAEPTFMMAIAIVLILCSAYVLFKGAGPWSVDGGCGCNGDDNTPDSGSPDSGSEAT